MSKPIFPVKKTLRPLKKKRGIASMIPQAKDVTACVVDYGTFICLAEKLAETYKKIYYFTPTSQEFYSIEDLVKADGLEKVERVFDIFDPDFIDKVDLFIFPDIGYGGLQRHLQSLGKAVWGSMGADALEVIRTEFIATLKKLKLPVIHSETVEGLTDLREHLSKVENKWIKVDKYRGNMETWHHIDMDHSSAMLDKLATEFGGLKDTVNFIVQDFIDTPIEAGYDGWCVDGQFPEMSFQGYEKKDELYLGSLLSNDEISEKIRLINEAMSPVLKEYSYRNFFATEIRVKDGVPYFIDPTLRMPGMTAEQLTETCANLAEVIWYGAHGVLIKPKFAYKFAATATLHHKGDEEGWRVLKVPKSIKQYVKVFHHCELGGLYHFPPKCNNELGVVVGVGNSIEEAVKMVIAHVKKLDGEPVYCELEGFNNLIDSIKEAEKAGIKFTSQKIPDLHSILE